MRDVVLVTADSVRRDFVDAMPFVDSHEVLTGVTAGHYTRPSLAALQSSRLRASVQSRVLGPSLAEVLGEAGYTTIGLVPTAQADPTFGFDAGFDHYDNYMSGGGDNPARNRRSGLREFLGSFDVVPVGGSALRHQRVAGEAGVINVPSLTLRRVLSS